MKSIIFALWEAARNRPDVLIFCGWALLSVIVFSAIIEYKKEKRSIEK